MAHKEQLLQIREKFHTLISKITSLQTVSFFFAYRLEESAPGNITDELQKEMEINIDKIENYYGLANNMLTEIEAKINNAGISDKCEPFIKAIRKEISGIYNQLIGIKDVYNKSKNFSLKENSIKIISGFREINPYCLAIADIYKEMKVNSVLEA